jgi:hypothetical protein
VKNEHEIWISSKPFFHLSGKPANPLSGKAASWFTILMVLWFSGSMACHTSVSLSFWLSGLPYFQKARITVLHISIFLEMQIQMSIMSIALLASDARHVIDKAEWEKYNVGTDNGDTGTGGGTHG